MHYLVDEDKAFIRLDQNQDLFESILAVAEKENWFAAHISGIGALKEVEVGYYRLSSKTYDRMVFNDVVELLSLEGNLSLKEGQRFLHLHAVLGNANFQCFGGHLFKAKVGVSCEINLRVFRKPVHREINPDIGLAQLSFCPI